MMTTAARRAGRTWNQVCQYSQIVVAFVAMIFGSLFQHVSVAQEPSLHERIDQLLGTSNDPFTAGPTDDALFLRRLSLDLRNSVPTSDELRAFLADPDPSKRANWIDKFLADPLFEERMVTWLDLMLMERRPAKRVDRQKWFDWLRSVVANSTPIDQWTRDMLTAPWWELDKQTQQRFFLDRDADPHLLTRDFGRVFLGRDMQCAQCHDHPLIDDYLQQDYQGLLSFFAPGSIQEVPYKDAEGKDQKANLFVEKPASDSSFESVFDKGKLRLVGAKLPHQPAMWESYQLPKDRLQPSPAAAQFGEATRLPQISRRKQLADSITRPDYRPFAENWSNRLWAMMFGQGVVHPVDMHQADNPAVNQQLLTLIASGLVELKFDAKLFLREIARSQAYQRAHWLPFEQDPSLVQQMDTAVLQQKIAELEAQVAALSNEDEQAEKAMVESIRALQQKEAELIAVTNELKGIDAKIIEQTKKTNEATVARDAATKSLNDERTKSQLLTEAIAKLDAVKALQGKDDPELNTSIQTATVRRDAANTEVTKFEAALAVAQTNLDAQLKLDQELTASAVAVSQKVEGFRESMEQLRQQELSHRQTWRQARERFRVAQSQKFALQTLNEYALQQRELPNRNNQLVASQAQLAAKNEQLAMVTQTVANATTVRDQATAKRDEVLAAHAKLVERAKQLDVEIQQLEGTRLQLAETAKLVNSAANLDSANTELAQSIESRRSNQAQLQTEMQAAQQQVAAQEQALQVAQQDLDKQIAATQAAQAEVAAATETVNVATKSIEEVQLKIDELHNQILERQWRTASAANLKPLSPEQFCWSILRVMGIFDQYVANERVELDKQQPLPADTPATEQQLAERNRLCVRHAIDKLRGNADVFANLFAPGAGQPDGFFASAEQALYMSNGGTIHSWCSAGNKNITERVAFATDPVAAASDLFETLLCRKPTEAEVAVVAKCLECPIEQRVAHAQELVWAMLCGVEFRFVQ